MLAKVMISAATHGAATSRAYSPIMTMFTFACL